MDVENYLERAMEEKILELHDKLRDIGALFLIFQERDNVERIKKIIPEIQEFVLWFLEGNRFGIEDNLYQDMGSNLLNILKDISVALQQHDVVLMHDAAVNGLMEYLKLFLEEGQEEETNGNL